MGVGVAIMYVLHKFVKYLLPQLVIAAVFAPLKARPVKFQHELGETDTISWAEKPVSSRFKFLFFLLFFLVYLEESKENNLF